MTRASRSPAVVVVGDCLLDVGVRHPPIGAPGGDVPAAIWLSPGGSGANVAVRLARRGLPARLVAPVARDPAGQLLRASLRAEGVELAALPAERSGTVVVFVSDDGERTMLSQRVAFPAGAAQRVADEARGAAWVHLSGYVLLDGRGAEIAGGLGARDDRQRLGVGACPLPDAARFAALLAAARPSVVFADLREAAALLEGRGADAPGLVARLASRLGSVVVVTTPGGPVAAMPGDRPIRARSAARVRRARDTTGAGDAVAAAVTAELLEAAWPPTGGELTRALSRAGALAAEVVASEGAQAEARGERSGRGAC